MYYPLVQELDFKNHFPSANTVKVQSTSKWKNGFLVLLDIWETEHYSSQWQMLVKVVGLKITEKFTLDAQIKWKCVHGMEDGKYFLGSHYSDSRPAILSLFKKGKLLNSWEFDRGFSTEISSIAPTLDGNILVRGVYYVGQAVGGHDEYYPEPWQEKLSKEGAEIEGDAIALSDVFVEESALGDETNAGGYFLLDRHLIKKYDKSGKQLWVHDTAITGFEKSFFLKTMAPYFRVRGESETITDGVWLAGRRTTEAHGNGHSLPTLFRATSGGTLLNFSQIFEAFPSLESVLSILPGADRSCYVLASTLSRGKGSGLCLIHIGVYDFQVLGIKYINFQSNRVAPYIESEPAFFGKYLHLKQVHTTNEGDGFIIFFNAWEAGRSDTGKIWRITFDK